MEPHLPTGGVGLVLAAVLVAALVREAPASHVAAERAARRLVARRAARGARAAERQGARRRRRAARRRPAPPPAACSPCGPTRCSAPARRELVDMSVLTGGLAFVAALPGLWLAGRAHPRTLAVAAAVVGGVATTAHVLVTELWMFAVAATIAVPLTVAAVAAGIPLLLRLVPPGESLGESVGMVAGPLALVTSIAAYASALAGRRLRRLPADLARGRRLHVRRRRRPLPTRRAGGRGAHGPAGDPGPPAALGPRPGRAVRWDRRGRRRPRRRPATGPSNCSFSLT